MLAWEDHLARAADLAAIPAVRPRAERFVVDVQTSAGYGHSGYPIVAFLDWTDGALDPVGSWGLFHELGHNHQNLDWVLPGSTECSVNLWSVYLHEAIGIPRDVAHPAIAPEARADRLASYLADGADFAADWNVWDLPGDPPPAHRRAWAGSSSRTASPTTSPCPRSCAPTATTPASRPGPACPPTAAMLDLGPFYRAWGFPLDPATLDDMALWPAWEEDPTLAWD